MAKRAQDEAFAKYVLQAGVVRIEHLEAARAEQEQNDQSLSQILVALGAITPLQREDIEKRVRSGLGETPPQLGNYRLLCKLGEGGMGAVYLCSDTLLDRQVALKVLPKDVTDNPELLSRFRREAVAAGKLNHANIASAFSVGEDGGHHFYVMEYCRGEPLDRLLKRVKRLPEGKIVQLVTPVARALQYAHEHKILHRDIKPANIMLDLDGTVKVLDLGLSKNVADDEQSFQTTSGLAIGTPNYISPEQARGDKVLDGRTDVYSLGATMFHLGTGRPPFSGNSAAVIMTKHLNDPVPDPRSLNPELSDGFAAVVMKSMSKEASDRYGSMNDLAADLERLADGQPVRALRKGMPGAGRGRTSGMAAVVGGERPSGRHDAAKQRGDPARPTRSGPSVLRWVATIAGAVLVGLVIFFLTRSGNEPVATGGPVSPRPPALPVAPTPRETRPVPGKAFEQLVEDLKTGDVASRKAKVDAFLATCEDPILAARARQMLEAMKPEPAWIPLFDKRSNAFLVESNAGNWLVSDGVLSNRLGSLDAAQTRRDFTNGRLRIRFSVSGASLLRFTIRQGREGGYSVYMDKHELAGLTAKHELILTFNGAVVSATLDGRPHEVQAKGAPLSGRLQFMVSEGTVRISALDFAETDGE